MRKLLEVKLIDEWENNKRKNLCPVCGKEKFEFEKYRRVYCSKKCEERYSECFLFWQSFRDKFLDEHGLFCDKCKKHGEYGEFQVDHIRAIINGGEEFNKNNLQVLCLNCHKKKTKVDLILNRTKSTQLGKYGIRKKII